MRYLSDTMQGDYLLGNEVSVADFYFLVTLLWASKNALNVPEKLADYRDRLMALPSVEQAMQHEGLAA